LCSLSHICNSFPDILRHMITSSFRTFYDNATDAPTISAVDKIHQATGITPASLDCATLDPEGVCVVCAGELVPVAAPLELAPAVASAENRSSLSVEVFDTVSAVLLLTEPPVSMASSDELAVTITA
jgi:hypothetical protein